MYKHNYIIAANRMNSTYRELRIIWDECTEFDTSRLKKIIPLLSQHGIKLRQRDGELKQITLSIPTSKENSYVVGLKYIKIDGTYTEDHFLCDSNGVSIKGKEIVYHPKRKLEYLLPEYKGTHKEIPDMNIENKINNSTDVTTLSYYKKNDK